MVIPNEKRKDNMAKYTVTYACGHTGTIELFGKMNEREYRLKQLTDQLCPDCYNQQVSKENQENGLPKLEGSEKQINWAEKIRKQNISKINGFIQDRTNTLKSWEMKRDESLAEGKEPDLRLLEGIMGCKMEVRSLEEILDQYKAQISAKVIIESRDDYRYAQDLLQRFINDHQWTTKQEAMKYFNLTD